LPDSFVVTSIDGTTQTVTITINGANDAAPRVAPTDIQLSTSVPLGSMSFSSFQFSGTLSATDPDPGAITFTIVGQSDPGLFSITGNSLTSGNLGQNDQFTVTVRATQAGDPVGVFKEETFGIITGSNGNNTADNVSGLTGDDVLYGNGGNDMIFGLGGNDTLFGQDGDDVLDGGAGANILVGGAGNDDFLIRNLAGTSTIITDFEAGANNTIVDQLRFDIPPGSDTFAIGDNDLIVENLRLSSAGSTNVANTEIVVNNSTNFANTAAVQTYIDGHTNITGGALFVVYNSELGNAAVYYDSNPNVVGGAVLVAELENITTLTGANSLSSFNAGDFIFI
jgi:hypothetical protein